MSRRSSCLQARSALRTVLVGWALLPLGADVASGETGAGPVAGPAGPPIEASSGLYSFALKDIDGREVSLSAYRGQALVLVNVASRCGFTPQYAGLERLYKERQKDGLVVLGFPSNDFRNQEPGTEAEIKSFCRSTYGVTFPLFSKIAVTGERAHPLYRWLTGKETNPSVAGPIEWNFTKFVVDRQGRVVARFPSRVAPDHPDFRAAVDRALAR